MATRAVPAPLAHLPNALTVGRLVVIPVFVALMVQAAGGHSWPAAILFGAAGATDQVDGFLARLWRVESRFGKIADPLADRLLIDAAVILLVAYGRLPWAGLVVIGVRDLLLLLGWRVLAPHGVDLDVNVLGKAATWVLYAASASASASPRTRPGRSGSSGSGSGSRCSPACSTRVTAGER